MAEAKDLIYEPEVGLLIPEAFARGVLMAKKAGRPVHMIVNDIEMDVTAKTNLKRVVAAYRRKLNTKTQLEIRSYQQRNR